MPVSWLTKLCNQGESLQQWIVEKQKRKFVVSQRKTSHLPITNLTSSQRRRRRGSPMSDAERCQTFEANDAIARDVHLLEHFVHFRVGELFAEIGHHVSKRRCEKKSFFLTRERERDLSSATLMNPLPFLSNTRKARRSSSSSLCSSARLAIIWRNSLKSINPLPRRTSSMPRRRDRSSPRPSQSNSLIKSFSSSSVGFCPRVLITLPRTLGLIAPSESLSYR